MCPGGLYSQIEAARTDCDVCEYGRDGFDGFRPNWQIEILINDCIFKNDFRIDGQKLFSFDPTPENCFRSPMSASAPYATVARDKNGAVAVTSTPALLRNSLALRADATFVPDSRDDPREHALHSVEVTNSVTGILSFANPNANGWWHQSRFYNARIPTGDPNASVFLRFWRRLDKVSASCNADGVQMERLKQTYAQDKRKLVALVASFTFL